MKSVGNTSFVRQHMLEPPDVGSCIQALIAHFAGLKLGLLDRRLEILAGDWARLDAKAQGLQARRDERRVAVEELQIAIAENGGDRLERLAAEIRHKGKEREKRVQRARSYGELLSRLGESAAGDAAAFTDQQARLMRRADAFKERIAALENEEREHDHAFRNAREEYETLIAVVARLGYG